jgi:hypothetical protein
VPPDQAELRGLAWVVGAFLICPCHLPLTLGLAATLLSGTVAAALLHDHPYFARAQSSPWYGWRRPGAAFATFFGQGDSIPLLIPCP